MPDAGYVCGLPHPGMRLDAYLECCPASRLLIMMIDSNAPRCAGRRVRIEAPSEVVWDAMTGLVPRLMRRQLHKSVQFDLDSLLQNLKIEAERRAA